MYARMDQEEVSRIFDTTGWQAWSDPLILSWPFTASQLL